MRIIDKNRDYYDYLQSSEDNRVVFDRRGSFTLTKEAICRSFWNVRYGGKTSWRFLLMQCGSTFWLFLAEITKWDDWGRLPSDFRLELFDSWKDYSAERKLLNVEAVSFCTLSAMLTHYVEICGDTTREKIESRKAAIRSEIVNGSYSHEGNLSHDEKITGCGSTFKHEKLFYPLLKECGIAGLVSAQDIFVAIEEYFSMEKTENETTEPKGITNEDKIVMHGFNVKTSFRGKR